MRLAIFLAIFINLPTYAQKKEHTFHTDKKSWLFHSVPITYAATYLCAITVWAFLQDYPLLDLFQYKPHRTTDTPKGCVLSCPVDVAKTTQDMSR